MMNAQPTPHPSSSAGDQYARYIVGTLTRQEASVSTGPVLGGAGSTQYAAPLPPKAKYDR